MNAAVLCGGDSAMLKAGGTYPGTLRPQRKEGEAFENHTFYSNGEVKGLVEFVR